MHFTFEYYVTAVTRKGSSHKYSYFFCIFEYPYYIILYVSPSGNEKAYNKFCNKLNEHTHTHTKTHESVPLTYT